MGWFKKLSRVVTAVASGGASEVLGKRFRENATAVTMSPVSLMGATTAAALGGGNAARQFATSDNDPLVESAAKNKKTLQRGAIGAGIIAAGIMTGGVGFGVAGAVAGGVAGAAAGGAMAYQGAKSDSAQKKAERDAAALKAGAVAPQAGEGATQGAQAGDELAVVDPVEEAAKRARAKNSKRVIGSGVLAGDDKLGSTGKLGSGI